MKNTEKTQVTEYKGLQKGRLMQWLSVFLVVLIAVTMLCGQFVPFYASDPDRVSALVGQESGRDITVHFCSGDGKDIRIHVNPGAGEETASHADQDAETEDETEDETNLLSEETETDEEILPGDTKDAAALKDEEAAGDVPVSETAAPVRSRARFKKVVISAEGETYEVTVTCGADSGIPEDADLEVEEILPADENGTEGTSAYGKSYEEYVSYTEEALGMEEGSAGYIRLFDISIVNKDDHSVKYQPAEGTTVDVRIELADAEAENDLSVVHF